VERYTSFRAALGTDNGPGWLRYGNVPIRDRLSWKKKDRGLARGGADRRSRMRVTTAACKRLADACEFVSGRAPPVMAGAGKAAVLCTL